MIDYSLAKELKDAGFDSPSFCFNENGLDEPTLSELIEACVKLERDGDFHLEAMHGQFGAGTCYQKAPESWHIGDTPEEAVARLWLALNKNV